MVGTLIDISSFSPYFYGLLGLYGLVSILELAFAFIPIEKARRIAKPFCLLALIAACFFIVFVRTESILYIIGLSFALLGDIFIIYKDKRGYLLLGGISFMLSHILYCFASLFAAGVTIEMVVHYLGGSFIFFSAIFGMGLFYASKKSAFYSFAGGLYFGILGGYFGLSLALMEFGYSLEGLIALFGATLFLISDCLIGLFMFKKLKSKRPDFYIMLTYLIAELLLCFAYLGVLGLF